MKRLILFLLLAGSVGAQTANSPNQVTLEQKCGPGTLEACPQGGSITFSGPSTDPGPEWRITCPKFPNDIDDPVIVHAKDRLEAMVDLGCTVWSDKEWDDAKRSEQGWQKNPNSHPQPKWIPDPSAGHYDCPDGWTAMVSAEPPVWSGSYGQIQLNIPPPPPRDKKGHVLGVQPPAPICLRDAR